MDSKEAILVLCYTAPGASGVPTEPYRLSFPNELVIQIRVVSSRPTNVTIHPRRFGTKICAPLINNGGWQRLGGKWCPGDAPATGVTFWGGGYPVYRFPTTNQMAFSSTQQMETQRACHCLCVRPLLDQTEVNLSRSIFRIHFSWAKRTLEKIPCMSYQCGKS